MNLTSLEKMQKRLNELMELPKDKFPSVLKLVEDVENLYKENKQLKEEKQELTEYLKEQIKEKEYKLKILDYGLDIVHTRSSIITYKEILSKIEKE